MQRIAASYDEATPKIHHLDRMPLPSREDAAAIMDALEEVIIPATTAGAASLTRNNLSVQERVGWYSSICAIKYQRASAT